MRRCARCKEKIYDGFMIENGCFYWDDSHSNYLCESCFKPYMDETCGVGNWKPTEDGEEDEYGGYYLEKIDGQWEGTGIFWTEWYDEDDDDEEDDDIDFENAK